ncbi:unnamed protein product [Trifolium pratense]|uniref:Uncharacterized protein n=1 Tax=Trifolium pratense TaxID=57577 RepID=A0ACB0LTH3_TRIPR|nr:unnamed protein product [Trifolium pratense]
MHLEELDDPQKFADEGVKVITWQEYASRLHELKDEITRYWLGDDRVTSLKLSIKEIISIYPVLSTPDLTPQQSAGVCNVLAVLQCVHPTLIQRYHF